MFQFTLPCRERHGGVLSGLLDGVFQSTLPCRERPEGRGQRELVGLVSIHAPV